MRINMSLRLALLLGSLMLLLAPHGAAKADTERLSVLELFTSQACSECPPADALLTKYAARSDVLALSFPIDHWDYLGWKDTLASPKHTSRWRAYATGRGDGQLYTPQAVVNGIVHTIGSHAADIDRAIIQSREKLANRQVAILAITADRMLSINIAAKPAGAKDSMATVWLAVVRPTVEVDIRQGYNRGKTITYVNVVRELTPVGAWTGAATHIDLPEAAIMKPGELCAVLLQAGEGGPILGAAWVKPKQPNTP